MYSVDSADYCVAMSDGIAAAYGLAYLLGLEKLVNFVCESFEYTIPVYIKIDDYGTIDIDGVLSNGVFSKFKDLKEEFDNAVEAIVKHCEEIKLRNVIFELDFLIDQGSGRLNFFRMSRLPSI